MTAPDFQAPPGADAPADERAAFEAKFGRHQKWCDAEVVALLNQPLCETLVGKYVFNDIQKAWEAWQAATARAVQAPVPAPQGEPEGESWPQVVSYAGGADDAGLYGWVRIAIDPNGPAVEYRRAPAPAEAHGLLHEFDQLLQSAERAERYLASTPLPVASDVYSALSHACDQARRVVAETLETKAQPKGTQAEHDLAYWKEKAELNEQVIRDLLRAAQAPAPAQAEPATRIDMAGLEVVLAALEAIAAKQRMVGDVIEPVRTINDAAVLAKSAAARLDRIMVAAEIAEKAVQAPAVGADDARDAARYRWLRSAGVDVPGCRVVIEETVRFLERMDSAIDAAMESKQ